MRIQTMDLVIMLGACSQYDVMYTGQLPNRQNQFQRRVGHDPRVVDVACLQSVSGNGVRESWQIVRISEENRRG